LVAGLSGPVRRQIILEIKPGTRSGESSMQTHRRRVLAGLSVLVLAARLSAGAFGAAPEAGDQFYRALRYTDDFSWLANPAKRSDPWDPLKFIPIGNGQHGLSYLSFGGELRERFESYLNPNFGIRAPPSNAYLLHRLLLHADAHITDYFRFFVQLGEMERLGNRVVTSTTDINHLELMQAFIDVRPPSPLGDAPVFRVGREELLFGFQRLIAVREGPNVRRVFDGFRFTDRIGAATIDLLGVRPANNSPGVFDDHANFNQMLWGGYLTVPVGPALKTDLYWLNYENKAARFRNLTGREQRQTFGVRLFGDIEGVDWNAELAVQTGSFRGRQIRAAMGAAIVGYTFRDVPWRPRIALEANAASGDNSRDSAIGTFNAMYPRLPYFAETSLLVPANVMDVRPVLDFRPVPSVLVTLG
jgi:Alginate export